jgi:hypothetical protein
MCSRSIAGVSFDSVRHLRASLILHTMWVPDVIGTPTAGKWRKCESYFGASTRELAAWVGHELGGQAPHQSRWASFVWAPRCRDCVMGCCGDWLFLIDISFLPEQFLWLFLGLKFCVLIYLGSAAPLLSL